MLLLTGEYELNLDEKNRLAVPAKLRDVLEQQGTGSRDFYLTLGTNRVLRLFPAKIYQRIALVVAPGTAALDEALAHDRIKYSLTSKVELDRQGRLLIGEKFIRRSKIQQQVTMIGNKDHLEIWDTERWEQYISEHFGEQEKSLLQARAQVMREDYEATLRPAEENEDQNPDFLSDF